MKLHDVFSDPEIISGFKWFRPVGYPKGYAWCVKDGDCYAVPSSRGGELGMTTDVKLLSGEWETVYPDLVLED